jgi:acetyl-CoA carboxylase carboxyltransferase component
VALEIELERLTKAREWIAGDGPEDPRIDSASTALGRVLKLVDDGSWLEIGGLARSQHPEVESITPRDGLVTGFARIAGQEVALLSEDHHVLGSTDGQVAKSKLWKMVRLAVERSLALVILSDGPANDVPGPFSSEGRLLGRVAPPGLLPEDLEALPGILVVRFGRGWQEARELVLAADLTIAVKSAPGNGDAAIFEGADLLADDATAALRLVRSMVEVLLSRRPSPIVPPEDKPDAEIPQDLAAFLEMVGDGRAGVLFATGDGSVATGVARIGGMPVAVVGPAPGGTDTLGVRDLQRIGRIARLSRRFGMPLLVIQDIRGYDPATYQSAPFLAAEAYGRQQIQRVEDGRICLVIGDGHVLGRYLLGGREIGYDAVFAWPWANIGVSDVPVFDATHLDASRQEGPWLAAGLGMIEDVITPAETRVRMIRMLTIMHGGRGWATVDASSVDATSVGATSGRTQ